MRLTKRILTLFIILIIISFNTAAAKAAAANLSFFTDMSEDSESGWPDYPEIYGEAAIVMEASGGVILYQKNMDAAMYPASVTKLLTALLVLESCTPDEQVYFSDNAVFSIPSNSSHIAMNPGEYLSVENCLYGLLLASANEVANALAEHVSGSVSTFVELMNKRAKELGAINSNFVNPHGLHDANHYTTCYDVATICQTLLQNKLFLKIDGTASYIIPPTNLQPQKRPVNTTHKLLRSGALHYNGCIGGKTGLTDAAGNTLVTFAERNGITLICVVMKSDSAHVNTDSTTLLDYGFDYFKKADIKSNETSFDFTGNMPPAVDTDLFHNPNPTLYLRENDCVYLPVTADFSDLAYTLLRSSDENVFAEVIYTYKGHYVGGTKLLVSAAPHISEEPPALRSPENDTVRTVIIRRIYLIAAAFIIIVLIAIIVYLRLTRISRMRKRAVRRRKHFM